MTAAVHPVLAAAQREVYAREDNRDRAERRDRVRHLTLVGESAEEIATRLGVSSRTVDRDRVTACPQLPKPIDPHTISDERAAELEQLAELAIDLVCALRDEDPAVTWSALSRLERRRLQELTVVALAMVPVEDSLRELLGWVLELPAAREARDA